MRLRKSILFIFFTLVAEFIFAQTIETYPKNWWIDMSNPKLQVMIHGSNIGEASDFKINYKGIKLDPFRICQIYEVYDFAMQTIIKKALKAGERGHKDMRQDLLDIINSAQRKLEMLDEDENVPEPKTLWGDSILKIKKNDKLCIYPKCNCSIEKPFDNSPCFRV